MFERQVRCFKENWLHVKNKERVPLEHSVAWNIQLSQHLNHPVDVMISRGYWNRDRKKKSQTIKAEWKKNEH